MVTVQVLNFRVCQKCQQKIYSLFVNSDSKAARIISPEILRLKDQLSSDMFIFLQETSYQKEII